MMEPEGTNYCACGIARWVDALFIANDRAARSGRKHKVWRGVATGKWHVTREAEPAC